MHLDYHSKFLIVNRVEGILPDNLVRSCKIIFAEYRLQRKKIISDTGPKFISENFQEFCRKVKICHVVSSSYNHQSNRQVKACIIFVKHTIKIYFDSNIEVNASLLQIRSILIGNALQSSAKYYSQADKKFTTKMNGTPIISDYDDEHY